MKKLLLLLLSALALPGYAQTKSILVLSDVHVNLSLGNDNSYHLDADSTLFLSAINSVGSQKFPFIIMPGDMLWHEKGQTKKHDTTIMKQTFKYVLDHLKKLDKNAVILPALGNNDCINHDSSDRATNALFYKAMLSPIDHNHAIYRDFMAGGYYKYSKGDWTFIMLNTVIFLSSASDPDLKAKKELSWLGAALQDAKRTHKKVWMVYHVPPGMDRYGNTPSWHNNIQSMYLDTIKKYAPVIRFQLAGHTHMDDYRLITNNGKLISYIDIAPGLCSRNGNNPAYQVIQYNSMTKVVTKVNTHYTDSLHRDWHTFGFKDFSFKFLMSAYDAASVEGKRFVENYFTNRKQKAPKTGEAVIAWAPRFYQQSTIKIK
jgi:hypothetical protein